MSGCLFILNRVWLVDFHFFFFMFFKFPRPSILARKNGVFGPPVCLCAYGWGRHSRNEIGSAAASRSLGYKQVLQGTLKHLLQYLWLFCRYAVAMQRTCSGNAREAMTVEMYMRTVNVVDVSKIAMRFSAVYDMMFFPVYVIIFFSYLYNMAWSMDHFSPFCTGVLIYTCTPYSLSSTAHWRMLKTCAMRCWGWTRRLPAQVLKIYARVSTQFRRPTSACWTR